MFRTVLLEGFCSKSIESSIKGSQTGNVSRLPVVGNMTHAMMFYTISGEGIESFAIHSCYSNFKFEFQIEQTLLYESQLCQGVCFPLEPQSDKSRPQDTIKAIEFGNHKGAG